MSEQKITELDKNFALMEQRLTSLEKNLSLAIGKMEAAQTRLFWLVAVGVAGAFWRFILSGGLSSVV